MSGTERGKAMSYAYPIVIYLEPPCMMENADEQKWCEGHFEMCGDDECKHCAPGSPSGKYVSIDHPMFDEFRRPTLRIGDEPDDKTTLMPMAHKTLRLIQEMIGVVLTYGKGRK